MAVIAFWKKEFLSNQPSYKNQKYDNHMTTRGAFVSIVLLQLMLTYL